MEWRRRVGVGRARGAGADPCLRSRAEPSSAAAATSAAARGGCRADKGRPPPPRTFPLADVLRTTPVRARMPCLVALSSGSMACDRSLADLTLAHASPAELVLVGQSKRRRALLTIAQLDHAQVAAVSVLQLLRCVITDGDAGHLALHHTDDSPELRLLTTSAPSAARVISSLPTPCALWRSRHTRSLG